MALRKWNHREERAGQPATLFDSEWAATMPGLVNDFAAYTRSAGRGPRVAPAYQGLPARPVRVSDLHAVNGDRLSGIDPIARRQRNGAHVQERGVVAGRGIGDDSIRVGLEASASDFIVHCWLT
jgi:hypothetical protein